MPSPSRVPRWADRLYAGFLHLYPEAFREDYANEMRAAFRGRWREERDARGTLGLALLWLAVLLDTLTTAGRSQGEMLIRDLRYGWRALAGRANWSFTAASLITLALGIGAVTAVFTIVHAVLLAPLPFREPEKIVRIWDTQVSLGIDDFTASMPNYRSWEQSVRGFSHLAAVRPKTSNITDGDEPEMVNGFGVSSNLWEMLGVRPIAGRTFTAEEDRSGAPVAVISEGLWQRRYGGERSAIGRTIEINLKPHVIIGVTPQDVGFTTNTDLWLPLGHEPPDDSRADRRVIVLGRLAPGFSLRQAEVELQGITARLAREFPGSNEGWSVRVTPIRDWIVNVDTGRRMRILLAAVGVLLLVAATNVANLQLARAVGRLREIGVRLALGASRARLVRQMLTESLLLATMGGVIGLAVAWAGVRVASRFLPASIPRLDSLALDLPVLLAAALCICVTALLTGLLPARVALRSQVAGALQQAGRTSTASRSVLRKALVAAQLALATTLVVCAALLTQSLVHLQDVTLGFQDPDHLLTTRITRSESTEEDGEVIRRNREFFDRLAEEVRALPGVAAVGVTSEAPFGDYDTQMPIWPNPRSESVPEEGIQAHWRIATGDYFRTMQIPLRRGRLFQARGEERSNMLLSEGLARRLWPDGEDPVGREVTLGNGQTWKIVGVVGDVRQVELRDEPPPVMYMSTSWFVWPTMTLTVRTRTDPAALAQSVRATVKRLDPRQPISAFETLRTGMARNAAAPRLNALLVSSFAGLALLLAGVGVAGVVGYSVGQRTREVAVRLVLGASPRRAMLHVMRDSLAMCGVGIALGIAAALVLGRALASVLFGVEAHDPVTFATTIAILLATAIIACWVPAQRAAEISPAITLHEG